MIAVQHSGSGKANQYFLRGFNLDHGTDFANYIDDVPMNLRTHGHGQGYLDVNGLIPEVIDRIDYRKGPYRADTGDFSMAGAAHMSTVTNLDPFIAAEGGKYDWQRLAGGTSMQVGEGNLVTVGEWKSYDGPWELAENLRHQSAWAKYSLPLRERSPRAEPVGLSRRVASDRTNSRARHRHRRVRERLLLARSDGGGRNIALDRCRSFDRRGLASDGLRAVLRLAHAVERHL